jgi:hypothetical protein
MAERVRADGSSYRDAGTYYVDGYMTGTFRPGAALDRLNATIARIQQPELQSPFTWKQKYDRTQDLRPSVYEYDTSFVDVLFESAIPSLLQRVTGFDLFLAHIQLRRVFPGKSYMDWHRDTYIYGRKTVGNLPPVHKLIFYPTSGRAPEPRLRISVGSHRRMLQSRIRDVAEVTRTTSETIWSSDDAYVLFDSSLLHAVVPETQCAGSIRVIYEFCHDLQLAAFQEHTALQAAYRSRLTGT